MITTLPHFTATCPSGAATVYYKPPCNKRESRMLEARLARWRKLGYTVELDDRVVVDSREVK